MIQSWKEYGELVALYAEWLRKHWKGYMVFVTVLGVGKYLWLRWRSEEFSR